MICDKVTVKNRCADDVNRLSAAEKKRVRMIAASLGCAAAALCLTACGQADQNSGKPDGVPNTVTAVADRTPQSAELPVTETVKAPAAAPESTPHDDSSEGDVYVPDTDNVFGSDHYTFADDYSEINGYDFDELLSDCPGDCTAFAVLQGTDEKIDLELILPDDCIYLSADGDSEKPFIDAVRNAGLTLPRYENGFHGNECWDYVEFFATYDPNHSKPLKAEFAGSMLLDKKRNIELKLVKEFVPKGTGDFTLDHIGAKSYDLTDRYKTLGSRGSIFGKYSPEVYENANGISFIITPVTLSFVDSKPDVTDLNGAGYIACCFADDGCVVISAENRELYSATEFPRDVDMISKRQFLDIIDEIDEDFLK